MDSLDVKVDDDNVRVSSIRYEDLNRLVENVAPLVPVPSIRIHHHYNDVILLDSTPL